MTERRYCADLCAVAREPMEGTADRVDVWLLLEYKPAWEAKAITDNALSQATRDWLQGSVAALAERGLKARPQFIRRPEIDSDETVLFVGTPEALFEFSSPGYDALTRVDVAALVESGDGPRSDGVRYFVCTNGKRDLCCARYGLPAYRRLRDIVGARVWQTTHLGGHRFAPNVLALPQGVLYGRVVPEEIEGFVDCIESGALSRPHLRGRSVFPPPAQAAEASVGEQVIELLSVDGDDNETTVSLRTAAGEVSLVVERSAEPLDVLASCGDAATKPIHAYRVRN